MSTLFQRIIRFDKKKSRPFLILFIIHFFLLGVTFYKKGKNTSTLLLMSIGIGYVFEYFVLNVFKMYSYKPTIFKIRWIDSVFGALLSQSVYVPITATLLSRFDLGWAWRIGFSTFYGVIERYFIHQGIFKNRIWNTWFTITTMPIYFYIVAKWWKDIQLGDKLKGWFSIFFCYWVSYTNILFFSLALFKRYRFRLGFLKDQYWEHFILAPIYTFNTGLIGTINTVYLGKNLKWLGILVLHLFDRILFKYKVMKPSSKIHLYSLLPIHICMLLFGEYIKFSLKENVHIGRSKESVNHVKPIK